MCIFNTVCIINIITRGIAQVFQINVFTRYIYVNTLICIFSICFLFLAVQCTEVHVVSQGLQDRCQHVYQLCKGWPIIWTISPAGYHHIIIAEEV